MKADVSRSTFDPRRHATSVRKQQGRVDLDADWNEQQDIDAHLRSTTLLDVVGAAGAPIDASGLGLVAAGADLGLSAGRYYVDGVLCENESLTSVFAQPDLRAGSPVIRGADGKWRPSTPAPDPGVYVAYVDVWTRHLSVVEDPTLREVALGGPDTTTRAQTVWQVRLLHAGAPGTDVTVRRRPAGLGRRDRPVDGHARRARRPDRRPLDRLHHAVVGAVPWSRQPVLPRRDPHRRGTGHRSLRALEGQRIGVRHVGRQRLQRADREEPRPRRVDRVREQLLGAAHRRPRRDGGPLRHAGPGRPRRGRSAHAEDVAGAVGLDRHRRLPPAPEGATVGRPRHRARRRRRGRPRPGHQGHLRHRDGDVPHRRLLVVRGPCRHPRRRVAAPRRRADTVHTARRAPLLRPPRRRLVRRHRLDGAARLPHRVRSARRPTHARLRRRRRSGGRPGCRQRGDARRPAPGVVGGGDDGRAPGRRGQGAVHHHRRQRPAGRHRHDRRRHDRCRRAGDHDVVDRLGDRAAAGDRRAARRRRPTDRAGADLRRDAADGGRRVVRPGGLTHARRHRNRAGQRSTAWRPRRTEAARR